MSVTLQYESWDRQLRFVHRETTDEAIDAAVEMARSQDGRKPMRILNENGAVLVSQLKLEGYIKAGALNERGFCKAVTLHVRNVETGADAIVHCGTIEEAVENAVDHAEIGRFMPTHVTDTDTDEILLTETQLKEAMEKHRFDVDIPQSEFDRLRQAELEEAMKEKEAMEATPMWGAW